MNIKNLSLKYILGENWFFEPDFCYADVHGSAELYENEDSMILFRRKGDKAVSAIQFRAVLNYNKTLFREVNGLIADIGIDIKMGDKLSKMIKKFGTPTFIDYIEEDYYRYYNWYYRGYYYDYNDDFFIVRYHYLLSPDLLVCFGSPKIGNSITDLEIVNDFEMVSGIMETRKACKELDKPKYQPKECLRLVNKKLENRKITGIQSKNVRFIKMEIENCSIDRIESENIVFRDCVFNHVIFDSHFETGHVSIKYCKFFNCVFHDTFGSSSLGLENCLFQHCVFEGMGVETGEGMLFISDDQFLDCTFSELKWRGEGMFLFVKMIGGKLEHIFYKSNEISCNEFSDVQIKNVELELDEPFTENEFTSVILENVKLNGKVFAL